MNAASNELKSDYTKANLLNIKSLYIIKSILLDYIQMPLSFKLIRYNKKIQNRININIFHYQEYSENLSPIEIEIIPKKNTYGIFINIEKEDEQFCHIYFNNEAKEIKRNDKYSIIQSDNINNIKIIIDYQFNSFSGLFKNCTLIEIIYIKKFLRKNISDISLMFNGCTSLKQIIFSSFHTHNVKDMTGLFYGCSSLKELNLDKFNTYNVINMSSMFYGCTSLEKINLDKFDTYNVINMKYMFYGCKSLKKLDISNFNIDQIKYMENMFAECSNELLVIFPK